jgi:hypothetical protein|tara:strand:+ start:418 stop:768 length:351 start_codon:yes stop_codon:yes gene_type:complete
METNKLDYKVIETYQIPHFGRVEIINSPDDGVHGKYWVRVENHGIVGRFSETLESARKSASKELADHALREVMENDEQMAGLKNLVSAGNNYGWSGWIGNFPADETPEVNTDGETE